MRQLLVLLVLAGCSINHRTDGLACERQSDCAANQRCTDGFCLTTGGNPNDDAGGPEPDGPVIRPDTFTCPTQCTSCNMATQTCTVDCGQSPSTCQAAINCPPGFKCNILCTRNDGCANVNCSQGESCNITCKGNNTCKNVTCGAAKCDIECSGGQSCPNINCSESCACDVACSNGAICGLGVQCPDPQGPGTCSGFGLDRCTSQRDGCDTCP